MLVRDATEADLPAIVAIYNAAIPGRAATADTEPVTVESRKEWFEKHEPARRPLWVAEVDGQIAAWIGLSSFYGGRPAYDATAEASMYIAPSFQNQKLGRDLMNRMIAACPLLGVTTLLAMFFDHNIASRRLCESAGFEQVGHLMRIADLDGEERGLMIAALRIPTKALTPRPPLPAGSAGREGVSLGLPREERVGANILEVRACRFHPPLLQQREIEAKAIAPLFRAMAVEVGEERAREILVGVIQQLAHEAGCSAATNLGGNELAQLKQLVGRWSESGALELTVIQDDTGVFAFNVTCCQFAEMYHRLGLADLGPILSCGRDAKTIEGFNSDIVFSRTQTIMEGAAFCNFRYERKKVT